MHPPRRRLYLVFAVWNCEVNLFGKTNTNASNSGKMS